MAYVDYKCLESLLIEGEDLIATEGIGSAITNLVKNLWKIITNAIGIIIKCFKGLFAKLKRSKGNKNNANNKASNNDSASNNQNNQRNNKSAEDERNQVHDDIAKRHDDAQKKLNEQIQKFNESHAQRQAELNEAIDRMNKAVYGKNEDDNDKSGSEIARDIITAIGYIERTTLHANRYMMSIHTAHTEDDIYDNSPNNGDISELINNINIMQNTIDLYDLADDKLTDNNKDEICNRLQSATRKLEETKAKFDRDQSAMMDKLNRVLNTDDPNISDDEKRSLNFTYRHMNRQLKNVQTGLIAAQKLAVSLTKII